jgi:hypothetical protein
MFCPCNEDLLISENSIIVTMNSFHPVHRYFRLGIGVHRNGPGYARCLSGQQLLPFARHSEGDEKHQVVERDVKQIIGHEFAKRALKIAASGEHLV